MSKNELIYWQGTPSEVRFPVLGEFVAYEGLNMRFVLKYIPGHHRSFGLPITSAYTGKPETEVRVWEMLPYDEKRKPRRF